MNHKDKNEMSSLTCGDKYIAFTEKISEISGAIAAFMMIPLVLVFLIEIVSRNIFNHPTTWAYGTCFLIGGCAAVLGFAYAMKNGAMVRIDVIHSKLSEKSICILDLILYLVLFLPLTIGGAYQCLIQAISSVASREMISVGSWNAPIWPTKIVMTLSLVILSMQGIAEMIKLFKKFKNVYKGMES